MVSFAVDGVEALDPQSSMAAAHRIRTRVIGEYDYGWMRISTHIYSSAAEVDLVLELVSDAARRPVRQRPAGGP
jgi:selenocysteine lyase/cysteine desulfurase